MVPSLYPKTYLSKEKFSGSFIVGFWNLYGGFLYHPPPPTKKKIKTLKNFASMKFKIFLLSTCDIIIAQVSYLKMYLWI